MLGDKTRLRILGRRAESQEWPARYEEETGGVR